MRVLHIDASILGEQSASRLLSREIVSRLKAEHARAEVQYLVQLLDPVAAEGVDRSCRGGRQDVPLHRRRSGRAGQG